LISALSIPKEQIGASYGDAFMAGVGIGLFNNLTEIDHWVQIGKIVQPDLEASRKYDFNYRLSRSLYENTKPLMHELSDSLSE
jgi:xylulokinase